MVFSTAMIAAPLPIHITGLILEVQPLRTQEASAQLSALDIQLLPDA
jgi:hypothetical protein